jgi:Rad3-related DNA helicase
MERDSTWYPYVTAKSIIQSLGRSIRNKDDHAMSYILDSDWTNFYARNERMFTDDFRLALHSLLR